MRQACRSRVRAITTAAVLLFAASACDDGGTTDPCAEQDCSGNGTCTTVAGEASCECDTGYGGDACADCAAGYQDHDDDGTCTPDCASTRVCPSEHMSCDDSSGTAECVCDDGFQDNDDDGTCTENCATAALGCGGHGTCDDSTGSAGCVCDAGYQDNDGDDVCLPDCATAGLDCHEHGTCDDAGGVPHCVCEDGYDRSDCGVCESAYYQDNDGDGVCTPTCYFSAGTFSCGENEVCSHASGSLECVCARGYQDNDADGTCAASCSTATADETAPLVCADPNGVCDDSSGTAACRCRFGFADDPASAGTDCLACAAGYQDNDADGTCLPDCATSGLPCALACDDTGGAARCVCAAGEQDNDNDGTCSPDCATAALVCDPAEHRVCRDESGTAECACDGVTYDDGMGMCRTIGGVDGDSCATEIDLDLTVPLFYADMYGARTGHSFGCDEMGFAYLDMVYRVHLGAGETRRLRFTVERVDTTGASFTPAVAILAGPDCDSAAEIACGVGFDPTTFSRSAASAEATLEGGPGGTDYHVVVGMYDRRGRAQRAIVRLEHVCGVGGIYSPTVDTCVTDPCVPTNPCTDPHRSWCVTDLSGAAPAHECRCDLGWHEDGSGGCAANASTVGEGCDDVTPLAVVVGAERSVTGSTAAATDDGEGSCTGDRPARDRVFGFALDQQVRASLRIDCDDRYDCLMHLRGACDERGSELLCADRGAPGDPEEASVTLAPGDYYLFVDGWNGRDDETLSDGDFTLTYSFHSNPCLDEDSACPGDPECTPSADWSGFSCACRRAGEVLHEGSCVDDPCDPDPCTDQPELSCVPDYAAGTSECTCGGIYVSDGAGGCRLEPDAEWTILWYLAMDNNLYYQTAHELDDVAAAAFSPDVRVVALVDRLDEPRGYYAEFNDGGFEQVVELGVDPDTGDWTTLRDFGAWAVENYPAQHYALVLADHGGAWKSAEAGPGAPPLARGICWDDDSDTPDDGIMITNGDLAAALGGITEAAGKKIDLVIYDACLMSEWETANATQPFADYMLASEDSSYGFMVREGSWTDWLDGLVAGADTMTPLDVAESFIDNYRATMDGMSDYVTTGALTDLATVDDLNEAVSVFSDALLANESEGFFDELDAVRRGAQQTAYNELVDLTDFARLVSEKSGTPAEVVTAADELRAQLDRSIVHGYANVELAGWTPYYGSIGLAGQNGLSVYLPGRYFQMAPEYTASGATWSARATWDDFLATFLTGGYAHCDGTAPVMDHLGDTVGETVGIDQCCGGQILEQTFRAPGPELHGIRIAVVKTAADGAFHEGFNFSVYRPGHGIVWGPAHWTIARNSGEPQFLCLAGMGLPTEPGEELVIRVAGGDPYPGDATGFQTPIEWPIEYAASAGSPAPYAQGEARVLEGETVDVTVGEYNGDGIEGTFWFEVY
ncbi:MAG: hypothetical protein HY905_13995 [Deltaproteobacteria bacterium]|nr:hypothetical protein [Deltaproteobacteria bacterium]